MQPIAIIGAMQVEVEDLAARLQQPKEYRRYGLTFREGTLEGCPVVVVRSGIGKVNAALCVQQLVDRFRIRAVINTGIAGAMDPRLHVGDFVVSRDAVEHDFDATYFGYRPTQIPQMETSDFTADPELVAAVHRAWDAMDKDWEEQILIEGRVASGDQFIADPAVKARIAALCQPACVEMEGAAIAHAAAVNHLPFAIIRCMSDTADDSGKRKEYDFNEKTMAKRSAELVRRTLQVWGGK